MSSIVLGVTGASGQPLAVRALKLLLENEKSIDLILSKGAYSVWSSENNIKIPIDTEKQKSFWSDFLEVNTQRLICHKWNETSATIASGSYKTDGMVIVPCTMGKIGRIANGYGQDLIERAADVHLKEQRKLVISPRESPFSLIHLRNMCQLSEAGAQIIPCIPSWYSNPNTLNEMIDFMVVRLFDTFGYELKEINRWNGKK